MEFIRGEAFGEKEPHPDVMAAGVKCIECHTTIAQGHSLQEVRKTCVQCHEDRYGKMMDEWQLEVSDRMKRLRLSVDALKVQRKRVPEAEKKNIDTLIKKVEETLKTVGEDKSKGVHNFTYAQQLISRSEEQVLSTKQSISKWLE
jgi:hypothetical protein